jgi:integrase
VETCLKEYIEWLEVHRRTGPGARYRANAFILPELGKIECAKLTAPQLQKWLENTANKPPRIRSKRGKAQRYRAAPMDEDGRRRRRATVNRTLTVLKAALNRAWADGKIPTDQAWRRVKPFKQADAARVRYLSIEEAKRLINASPKDFRLLVEGALATGARYSELAALNVEDFNPDSGTIHIRTSKSGRGRHVVLTDEGIALFASLAAGREGEEPMFLKATGERWATAHQTRPMGEACKAARITPAAGFHCLRHTYASHAIMNGAPLIVAAKNLGHADTRMVERHYGHLAPSYLADTIRATAPRFGISAASNVSTIRI